MTILASTVNVKTMADDSLRLTIDISPQDAQAAFSLFGARGLPCVIARLTPEAAIAAQQADTVAADTEARVEAEKPVGGDLARLAARFCQTTGFWEFIDLASEHEAAEWVRWKCGVKSRAELDHNETAKLIFHEDIRKPFAAWCRARGIS